MNKLKNKYVLIPIIIALLSIIALVTVNSTRVNNSSKLYVEFIKDLSSKNISTVYLASTPKIRVKLNNGSVYETDNPRTNDFKEMLLKQGVQVFEKLPSSALDIIPITIFSLSILAILVMLIKSSSITSKGMLSVEAVDTSAMENIKHNFNSVAGNEEAKESVKDIVDFLKNPEKYNRYGARMPRGIILYGEPGTGKTLLAKAVAGEANVPFYAMSGSDFIQVYVGVGASRIRQLFKKARSNGKAVIFIDEIDAIGKKRDNNKAGGSDERDQTLNALLTEMSGFKEMEGIVVMAATNRLDMLDPALLRPGRFDRHIEIALPDIAAREKIIKLHLQGKPASNIDFNEIAQKTAYFSGAKIECLINEAAILACKEGSTNIENGHLDKAFSIVLAGHEKINRGHIKENDKKITAFHEAGHALISLKVLPLDKVSKITIIPSTKGAGGYTLSIPEDKLYQNKDYLRRRIMVLLGGRAAEEIIFGENYITTGAYSDLKSSTSIVTNMITEYGMGSTLGLLNLQELSQVTSPSNELIIKECKDTLAELYEEVKEILLKEKALLQKFSHLLIEKETLTSGDITALMNS